MTDIITTIIGAVALILSIIISSQLVPWLKEKRLYDLAVVTVNAVEALYGRYNGEQKFTAALDSLKEYGYDIESNKVIESVRAAWKKLDQAMYLSGEKITEK